MILDTQEQKDLLIKLIESAGISGNMQQAKELVTILEKLLDDVRKAEVKIVVEKQEKGMSHE